MVYCCICQYIVSSKTRDQQYLVRNFDKFMCIVENKSTHNIQLMFISGCVIIITELVRKWLIAGILVLVTLVQPLRWTSTASQQSVWRASMAVVIILSQHMVTSYHLLFVKVNYRYQVGSELAGWLWITVRVNINSVTYYSSVY